MQRIAMVESYDGFAVNKNTCPQIEQSLPPTFQVLYTLDPSDNML